jgi:hypothetical protein
VPGNVVEIGQLQAEKGGMENINIFTLASPIFVQRA